MKSAGAAKTLRRLKFSPEFFAAVLLLLFPLPLVWGKAVAYRALESTWERFRLRALIFPWHWVDLGRGLAGVLLLRQVLGIEWKPLDPMPRENLLAWSAVIILAPIVQSVVCRERDSFLAPFVTVGAIIALGFPPVMAGLTLVTALAVAMACRSGAMFFWAAGVSIPLFGSFFFPVWILLGAGTVAAILPALAVMLFHREFVLALRPGREISEGGYGRLR